MATAAYAQTTLTVAAAADLSVAEVPLAAAFQKANPGLHLRFVNGASAALAQQIQSGAPYDVFLSANVDLVNQLRLEEQQVYAIGHLALLFKDHSLSQLADLEKPEVRFIALANPKLAPYGFAGRQALERSSLWNRVEKKIVYAENVRQALQLFDSGNADAVLTAAALVRNRHATILPEGVVQKGGIVPGSANVEAAKRFMAWLRSDQAAGIFAQFGFGKPATP